MNKFFTKQLFFKSFSFVFVFLLIVSPVFLIFAQNQNPGIVPCGRRGQASCGFYDLITLINNLFSFIFLKLVIPLAAILFAWAGILLLTSGGNSGQKDKAKGIFGNVILGLFIAGAAWLLVKLFLEIMGYQGQDFFSN